jgi:exopolysaccharide biosynthesis polyprenyl glycosylphosphotransferase
MLLDAIVLFMILTGLGMWRESVDWALQYWYRASLPIVLMWFVLNSIGGYSRNTDLSSLQYISQHLIAMMLTIAMIVLAVYIFSFRPSLQFSRSVLPGSFILFSVVSLVVRALLNRSLNLWRKKRFYVVVGADATARELYEDYSKSFNYQRLRYVDPTGIKKDKPITGEGSPIIESADVLNYDQLADRCDGIILACDRSELNNHLLEMLVLLNFKKIPLFPIRPFYGDKLMKEPMFILNHWWILDNELSIVHQRFFITLKRLSDILISFLGIVLATPLMIVAGVLIFFTSPGPVIFRQIRVGKNHSTFTMYKFRTMNIGSEHGDRYARQDDQRITWLGKYLRLSRLDELPQLFNVLTGQMSLIGPRAEWSDIARTYEKKIPHYHFRHLVRPGITGWAQVNYPYGENIQDTIHKLQYDLYYISHYSFLLDLGILLRTMQVMFFGKGR